MILSDYVTVCLIRSQSQSIDTLIRQIIPPKKERAKPREVELVQQLVKTSMMAHIGES